MFSLSVPKPCSEDWEKMKPCSVGRFCNVCNKTVVDFTVMTDDQMKNYFLAAGTMKPCGRFNNHQLTPIVVNIPANILKLKMAAWKKFLAAVFIVFSSTLFSCDTNVDLSNATLSKSSLPDTTKPYKKKMGEIKMPDKLKDTSSCQQPTMGVPMRKEMDL